MLDRQISQLFNSPPLGVPPLDPIPFDQRNIVTWAELHQAVHSQQDSVLGVSGVDLTSLDLSQPERVRIWIELHAREHQYMSLAVAQIAANQQSSA